MRIILLIAVVIIGITVGYFVSKPGDKADNLPVINPTDLESEMVDSLLWNKGYGHRIGDFNFTDQDGKAFGLKDVKGKVFVAEYFFTTCGSICPIMNKQLQRVQKAFLGKNEVKILSFTVNPEVDTVAQMKRYAERHHADSKQWHFLTGNKADLYHTARTSFFVLKPAEAENLGDAGSDFIHTNNFVLVDQQQRIRGYFDGTKEAEVDKLIHAIGILLKEKE